MCDRCCRTIAPEIALWKATTVQSVRSHVESKLTVPIVRGQCGKQQSTQSKSPVVRDRTSKGRQLDWNSYILSVRARNQDTLRTECTRDCMYTLKSREAERVRLLGGGLVETR